MPNMNKVMLMGNLTRDPELKYTPKGTAVCALSLAINHSYKTAEGEKREEVTFVDVEAFGKQAETVAEYLSKGRPVFVEGRLKLDSWQDKESGAKRSKLKVVMESFQFIDGKPAADHEPQGEKPSAPARAARSERAARPERDPDLDAALDDIPF